MNKQTERNKTKLVCSIFYLCHVDLNAAWKYAQKIVPGLPTECSRVKLGEPCCMADRVKCDREAYYLKKSTLYPPEVPE